MQKIRKAVFPVAGLGTRFLPATKAMPKEMLPIVDKPLIQYAVEEAAAAGIEEFIFVTGRGKTSIEDHFDHSPELEYLLRASGREDSHDALASLIFPPGSIFYTRQQEPLGLGHAVWCARHFIKDEPFAVLSADEFMYGSKPCLQGMMEAYELHGGNVLAVTEVPRGQVSRYGIVKPREKLTDTLVSIDAVIEKPSIQEAPSTLAIVGRYIMDPRIFYFLEKQQQGKDGEIQLTDAFLPLLKEQAFYGFQFQGERFDCGSKAGYVAATIKVGLERPDLHQEVMELLRKGNISLPPIHDKGVL
jgi:UTP--glucose-1-phosphate uridylyltransferase